jgi:hypothetical protein
MRRRQESQVVVNIVFISFLVIIGLGWFKNVAAFYAAMDYIQLGETVVRTLGVLIPPFGAILGYFF